MLELEEFIFDIATFEHFMGCNLYESGSTYLAIFKDIYRRIESNYSREILAMSFDDLLIIRNEPS